MKGLLSKIIVMMMSSLKGCCVKKLEEKANRHFFANCLVGEVLNVDSGGLASSHKNGDHIALLVILRRILKMVS